MDERKKRRISIYVRVREKETKNSTLKDIEALALRKFDRFLGDDRHHHTIE
jgi:hypothetical protein